MALLTTISAPCRRAIRVERGADEEQRVWYVGVTRGRKRTMLIRDEKCQYRKKLPPI